VVPPNRTPRYRRAPLDGAPDPDFDVISAFIFDDMAAYEDMLATHARPEVAAAIAADEEKFLDRSRTRMYVVDVRES